VKYSLFLSDFEKKLNSVDKVLKKKYSNLKFNENPSSWSRVAPCGRTDGQTFITKLVAAFHSFSKAPKKPQISSFNSSETLQRYIFVIYKVKLMLEEEYFIRHVWYI
jgi:hypothetical protein